MAIERKTRPEARGLAGHGWTKQQAAVFAAQCEALGFADAQVRQDASGRRPTLSVTARNPGRK